MAAGTSRLSRPSRAASSRRAMSPDSRSSKPLQGAPCSSRTRLTPCRRLRFDSVSCRLPARILLKTALAQIDLILRDRIDQVLRQRECRRRAERSEPRLLFREIVRDHRIRATPAPDVEEPLALHRQLEASLIP